MKNFIIHTIHQTLLRSSEEGVGWVGHVALTGEMRIRRFNYVEC